MVSKSRRPIPGTTSQRACVICGVVFTVVTQFADGHLFALCDDCWSWPGRLDEYVQRHIYDDPPLDPEPSPYGPATEDKIDLMRERLLLGYAIRHPLDPDMSGCHPGEIKPKETVYGKEVIELDADRARGIEMAGKRYRVRIYWEGKKQQIGMFGTRNEAVACATRFWRGKIGLWHEWCGSFRTYKCAEMQHPTHLRRPRRKRYIPAPGPQLPFDEEAPKLKIWEPAA